MEQLYKTIVDFFVDASRREEGLTLDLNALMDIVTRLPGSPDTRDGVRNVPSRELSSARAIGALLYVTAAEELASREAAGL